MKLKLIAINFLQFAIWGAYLTSQGVYLSSVGMGANIGNYYAIQGVISCFMPALIGIIADRWVQAQKVYGICHLISAMAMIATGVYGMKFGADASPGIVFALYTLAIMFYMPTIALSYSVSYTALESAGMDTVKSFPPIRVWGTVGFILSMWTVNILRVDWFGLEWAVNATASFQNTPMQYAFSGLLGVVLGFYAFTMPACPVSKGSSKSFVDALGLKAFTLFKDYRMALFFIFSMLLGMALQVTNGFANPFISSFGQIAEYAGSLGVKYSNILISISQISETLCILLIPFCLRKWGIKRVMMLAMLAWVFRFGLFAVGNPGSGVWLLLLSMIVYGVAFDFFNISGSLFVNENTDESIRSSAQGLLMLMSNGLGAAIGTKIAQAVVNAKVPADLPLEANGFLSEANAAALQSGWSTAWFIFAAYALVVLLLFTFLFKYKHIPKK
ncbi:MAG: MFS transporter [Bacteroidales bacterium]|nr:MFS transporter [Bacteroidales bacterium]